MQLKVFGQFRFRHFTARQGWDSLRHLFNVAMPIKFGISSFIDCSSKSSMNKVIHLVKTNRNHNSTDSPEESPTASGNLKEFLHFLACYRKLVISSAKKEKTE